MSLQGGTGCGTLACGAGTCTQQAVGGVTTWPALQASAVGTGCRLQATATLPGGVDNEPSSPFTVVAGGTTPVLTGLVFLRQPAHAIVGVAILPSVLVRAVDQQGITYLAQPVPIGVTLEPHQSGATLIGGSAQLVTGTAVFNSLILDTVGSGYRLRATSGTLSVASEPFNASTMFAPVMAPGKVGHAR